MSLTRSFAGLIARTVTKWAVCGAFTRGWDARYVEDCRDALKVIRRHGNRLILGSRLTDYSHIQWLSSEYPAPQRCLPEEDEVGGSIIFDEHLLTDPQHDRDYNGAGTPGCARSALVVDEGSLKRTQLRLRKASSSGCIRRPADTVRAAIPAP